MVFQLPNSQAEGAKEFFTVLYQHWEAQLKEIQENRRKKAAAASGGEKDCGKGVSSVIEIPDEDDSKEKAEETNSLEQAEKGIILIDSDGQVWDDGYCAILENEPEPTAEFKGETTEPTPVEEPKGEYLQEPKPAPKPEPTPSPSDEYERKRNELIKFLGVD